MQNNINITIVSFANSHWHKVCYLFPITCCKWGSFTFQMAIRSQRRGNQHDADGCKILGWTTGLLTSDVTHMNSNKGNSEGIKKAESSSDQMFSFRSKAQLWAVITDWSLLGSYKRPSTLRLQPCSNKQQRNRQTKTRRNSTLNPNKLSGSFVFAHGNA